MPGYEALSSVFLFVIVTSLSTHFASAFFERWDACDSRRSIAISGDVALSKILARYIQEKRDSHDALGRFRIAFELTFSLDAALT